MIGRAVEWEGIVRGELTEEQVKGGEKGILGIRVEWIH